MARVRRHEQLRAGELNLTAMIDVAFQLLAFFIITLHPVDVATQFQVATPAPATGPQHALGQPLQVTVLPDGVFRILNHSATLADLDGTLARMSKEERNPTVLIKCTPHSAHGSLIAVLDSCARNKLTNLSVVSVE